MFTGIIETVGIVKDVVDHGSNKTFWIESSLSSGFKIDQSISHNGACLTVEEIRGNRHRVTAIDETLQKTNLGAYTSGTLVNIEQCLPLNGRLDGHFVQGHVDTTGICIKKTEKAGSWEFEFGFPEKFSSFIIEKGSICVEGISLTAFNLAKNSFTVAIIPYTFDHTNCKEIVEGSLVNVEFDLLGKYIQKKLLATFGSDTFKLKNDSTRSL